MGEAGRQYVMTCFLTRTPLTILYRLFASGKYADLVVRCGNYTARVHKAIVCAQSDWFAKAVDEGRFVEGQEGVVEFKEESPRAVRRMLEFLYTGEYTLTPEEETSDEALSE